HPNEPKLPVFGGRNTFQFSWAIAGCFRTKGRATAMNVRTAASLTNTTTLLKFADSLMPMIKIVVTPRMARKATRLNAHVACGKPASWSGLMLRADSGD